MTTQPIALILGAGARVGTSVASSFAGAGYKVAVASRSGKPMASVQDALSLKADFAKPEQMAGVFESVKSQLGAAPSVVIYNAAALTPPPEGESVLSIGLDSMAADTNVNTVSAYAAAQQAVLGWAGLPAEMKKSFIYTGNILNTVVLPVPVMLTLGTGKAASAYWIGACDALYKEKGYRFFYADQRKADGQLVGGDLDGPAHGEFYEQLATHEGQVPWEATFVKGQGYVKFN